MSRKPDSALTEKVIDLKGQGLPLNQLFTTVARRFIGVHEENSNNEGIMVQAFQGVVGNVAKEPWCLSFIQGCLMIVERFSGRQSSFPAVEHCQTAARDASKLGLERQGPRAGYIVIWAKTGTTMGHAGIVVDVLKRSDKVMEITTVEGNTGGEDERDGDCVAMKIRRLGLIPGFDPPRYFEPDFRFVAKMPT